MNLRLSLFFLFSLFAFSSTSQLVCGLQNYQHNCGEHGLLAIEEDMFTQVPPPAHFVPGEERSVVINVTYNGFSAAAEAAFAYAVDIWASTLTSGVVINVTANWTTLGAGVLGSAGPNTLRRNFTGATMGNTWYPIALANKLNGSDLAAGQTDITANFNSSFNWYLGTDGNTPGGQYDFVTVVLHELGHGLGFVGSGSVSGSQGFIGSSGSPYIYDQFVENNGGTNITSFTNGSTALGDELTGNQLYWFGASGMANNGGNRPRIYAPGSWNGGSSYSHLNESTYGSGNINSLMTPQIGSAESNHNPGPITVGMFEDMGWSVGACNISDVTVGGQFPCNSADNTYIQQVTVTYENEPPFGFLVVNGTNHPISVSPQTLNIMGLVSDGQPVTVDVYFSDEPSCSLTMVDLFTAPESCCVAPRLVSVDVDLQQIEIHNYGTCSIDLSNYLLSTQLAVVQLSTTNLISGSLNLGPGADLVVQWPGWIPSASGADMCLYKHSAVYTDPDDLLDFTQWGSGGNGRESVADAKGIWTAGDFVGQISPFTYIGDGTQNGVNFWEGTQPPCSMSNITAGAQSVCDPFTILYTQEITVEYSDEPGSGTLDVNGQSFSITSSPQTLTLVDLPSDGLSVDVTASFSAEPGCTFTVNSLFTAPPSCVNPCPTDISGDGVTDIQDMLLFLADFGCSSACVGDFDGNDSTDAADLIIFLASFGTLCP